MEPVFQTGALAIRVSLDLCLPLRTIPFSQAHALQYLAHRILVVAQFTLGVRAMLAIQGQSRRSRTAVSTVVRALL
jgi:hypothetical protein